MSFALDANRYSSLSGRGETPRLPGDLAAAEEDLRRAIHLDPTRFTAYRTLGTVLLDMARWSEAVEVLDQSVRLAPGDPMPRHLRGIALYRSGQAERAIADLEFVLAHLDPNDPSRAALLQQTRRFHALARELRGGRPRSVIRDP